jgi:hypothetical protein
MGTEIGSLKQPLDLCRTLILVPLQVVDIAWLVGMLPASTYRNRQYLLECKDVGNVCYDPENKLQTSASKLTMGLYALNY